jgi:hypothetical protein
MASYFIYDSINMYRSDNTLDEGNISGASPNQTFASSSPAFANHERAADQNIGTTLSGTGAIQYDLGASATANAAAIRFNGASGGSNPIMKIKAGESGSITNINTTAINSVASASWVVVDCTETTADKFYGNIGGSVSNISEILIGKKLTFEIEPDVNVQSSINYNNEVQRSLGGVEYAINVNPGQEVFTISFQNISSTFKSDLITMQDALKGEAKKFVWYDGSSFNWVRLDKPMTFTEIADGRFSLQITMRQQIQ